MEVSLPHIVTSYQLVRGSSPCLADRCLERRGRTCTERRDSPTPLQVSFHNAVSLCRNLRRHGDDSYRLAKSNLVTDPVTRFVSARSHERDSIQKSMVCNVLVRHYQLVQYHTSCLPKPRGGRATEAGNEGAVGEQKSPSASYYSIDQSHIGITAASPSQEPQ